MSVQSIDNLQHVIDHDLCNRCGTCVGLSGGSIVFGDKTGDYLPGVIADISPDLADRIWNACPGKNFDFPGYRKLHFSEAPHFHLYTGAYQNIFIGYANDENVRRNSASGGILTAILLWLLKNRLIDGAVVTRMSKKEPWLAETFIATTPEGIIEAAQSKYIITSVNEILPQMEAFEGKLAYVGLPGQVQGIRKLQAANDPSVRNIEYIFGPFYGNTLHFSSIKSFLRSHGERNFKDIASLHFRYGEWPGNMRIEMK
ncbi:MAG TPA: coenzyme F420 hydrogenase/dehydrogenase beta subunit N-terminal domain-containing protein, partial [Bacteroidales bacterium]|nr:coenzyme F420 hydrogenase/dehydrogenase beta subunit N-terminal domain-containing protein [Bacteroidales bacterium]